MKHISFVLYIYAYILKQNLNINFCNEIYRLVFINTVITEIGNVSAEEDNKIKDRVYEDEIPERMRRDSDQDPDEAKYSPEEKSIVDKSEVERTPTPSTPSEESEEDEGMSANPFFQI